MMSDSVWGPRSGQGSLGAGVEAGSLTGEGGAVPTTCSAGPVPQGGPGRPGPGPQVREEGTGALEPEEAVHILRFLKNEVGRVLVPQAGQREQQPRRWKGLRYVLSARSLETRT